MANWRLAKSLEQLRKQINAASPNRSKVSDGTIGDPAHASRGDASDHNPWFKDSKGVGVVSGMDITNDPDDNVDGKILSRALITDTRVKYVIFNGQIWKARTGKWEPYRGPNPHRQHVHVSVLRNLCDEASSWDWPPVAVRTTPPVIGAATLGSVGTGSTGGPPPIQPQTPSMEVSAEDAAKGVTTGQDPDKVLAGATAGTQGNAPESGPPPPAQAVEVKASRPSIKSTAVAILTFLMGPLSYFGIDARQVGEFAKGNLTLALKIATGLAFVVIAVWVWDRAMERANMRTLKVIDKASDKDAYSVRLVGGKLPPVVPPAEETK